MRADLVHLACWAHGYICDQLSIGKKEVITRTGDDSFPLFVFYFFYPCNFCPCLPASVNGDGFFFSKASLVLAWLCSKWSKEGRKFRLPPYPCIWNGVVNKGGGEREATRSFLSSCTSCAPECLLLIPSLFPPRLIAESISQWGWKPAPHCAALPRTTK